MKRAIVLLARAPSAPGKTRLTAGLEPAAALALRRALLLDTFEAIWTLDLPIRVAFTPDDRQRELEALVGAPRVTFVRQAGSDLGERMHLAVAAAFDDGTDRVVLVGSDLPTLPATRVADAFVLLDAGTDAVLGPTEDGGYYLVGAGRGVRVGALFEQIDWAANVLEQTLTAADHAGLSARLVEPWFDVDRPEDLARVAADSRSNIARHTRAWLQSR